MCLFFVPNSKHKKKHIFPLCTLFHNAETGVKDTQDWILYFFRGHYTTAEKMRRQCSTYCIPLLSSEKIPSNKRGIFVSFQ